MTTFFRPVFRTRMTAVTDVAGRLVLAIFVALIFCALMAVLSAPKTRAEDYHSNPWLKSWIPATCCVTNDCCWEIHASEVQPRPGDEWLIVSTGQIRKRTDWSPDGKYYRCACDYDGASKTWVKHQGANTRCIFVPMQFTRRHPAEVHP